MKTFNILPKARWLVTITLLLSLCIPHAWGDLANTYTKVTAISDLDDGDVVVLATESSSLPSLGVSGQNGTNDAAVSNTESDWVQYEITLVKVNQTVTGWTLYNPTLEKYVQSPTGNHFKHGNTGGTCSVKTNADGQYTFTCNTRYLQKNGNYYRMYSSINNSYTPFYVWKVTSSCTSLDMSAVTATPGNTQIALSWPAVSHADSYTVTCKVKSSGSSAGSVGGVTGSTTKSCTITGLTNGTEYTWSVMPVGSGDYCASNTPAIGDATPNVYYTVTWMVNGSSYRTSSVANGSKPVFPDDPSSCDGTSTTFYGWAAAGSTWSGKLNSLAGKTVYTSAGSMPNVTGAVTYHAVFAKATITGTDRYVVTTTLSSGKQYVFGAVQATASTTLANNTTIGAIGFNTVYSSTTWGQYATFTPNSDGEISAASVGSQYVWTLSDITSGNHTFTNAENATYPYLYLSTSTGSNQAGRNTTAAVYVENVTSTCKDAFLLHPTSSSTNRLMWNTDSRYGYRMYGSSTNPSASMCPYIRFYEFVSGTTYSEYLTNCCTQLAQINGSSTLNIPF
ncbi:MAG: fibronectin type III domain-containing protein [Paludibacteraceae bacterium]|nr:fibronectin type III domain-containing protein [Paludibacteraceae bacterium]